MLIIGGQEMKMVSGDAEGARKPGRPQPDKRSLKVRERKFALRLRGVNQPCSRLRGIHGTGAHFLESTVEPQGVEDVARAPEGVAACLQILEAPDGSDRDVDARVEPGDDGEGRARVR